MLIFLPLFMSLLKIKVLLPINFHIKKRFITQITNNLTKDTMQIDQIQCFDFLATPTFFFLYFSGTALFRQAYRFKGAVKGDN